MAAPAAGSGTSGLPTLLIQIAFTGTKGGATVGANPNDPTITPIWTDVTKRVVSFKVKRGKQAELDESEAADNSMRLRNNDGRFDPDNTAGPYYPNVVPFRAYRIQLLYGATSYTIATGYVEAWDQTWDKAGTRGWVDCTLTDAFGLLSQMVLISCLASEMILDAPTAYWPLAEPSSVNQGQNIAATAAGPLAFYQAGSGGSVAFGATTLTGLVGAGASTGETSAVAGNTTGVLLTNGGSSIGQGPGLIGQFNSIAASAACSVELWVTGYTQTQFTVLLSTQSLSLVVDTAGYAQAAAKPADGSAQQFTSGTVRVNDGNLHHIAATFTGGTLSLYVDGALAATVTGMTGIASASSVQLGWPGNTMPTGTFAHVAYYATALSAARVAAHYNAGVNAFPESTSARFTRLLSYGPWAGLATIPAGNSNMAGVTDCSGKSCLAALQDVVKAEQGNMYVSAAGAVVFENRNNRAGQFAPIYRFTDVPTNAATDLTYGESPTVVRDPATIYNALVVQRPGGGEYRFFDTASILQNFPRAHPDNPLELPLDTDQNLQYAAQFIVGRYSKSYARLEGVTVQPSSNPALYPLVGALEIGQRVSFTRTPREAAPISNDYFVEQIEHTWDAASGEYNVNVEMSPAAWAKYQILTAARGTLNANTTVGATSFVVNVTPTSGNTLAQDGWTKSAMPTIKIHDLVNGDETLTVSGMAYGTNQVTITTSPATKPHGAGVTVAENYGTAVASTNDAAAVLDGQHQLGW